MKLDNSQSIKIDSNPLSSNDCNLKKSYKNNYEKADNEEIANFDLTNNVYEKYKSYDDDDLDFNL